MRGPLPPARPLAASVPAAWRQAFLSTLVAANLALGGLPDACHALDMSRVGRDMRDMPMTALRTQERKVIDMFQRATPSVVYITTFEKSKFTKLEVEAGTGSGFVWDAEGRIITNYHVR